MGLFGLVGLVIIVISVGNGIDGDPLIGLHSVSFNDVDSHVNILNVSLNVSFVVRGGALANHDGTGVGNKKGGDSHLSKFLVSLKLIENLSDIALL